MNNNMNNTISGLIGFIIGLLAGILLVPYLYGPSMMGGWGMMKGWNIMDERGGMMSQNIDQHFIVQMIPHHEGAIAMANIALERSKRPEILSLAEGIIEAQEREINDMKSWYQDWYGLPAPQSRQAGSLPPEWGGGMPARQSLGAGGGMMQMGGMEGDVDELAAAADADFDREFIVQMIPHHEMAVVMAQMLASGTERSEMKQLADNIITSQSREIEMMRSWLTSWY